jgi:hypothetical protein
MSEVDTNGNNGSNCQGQNKEDSLLEHSHSIKPYSLDSSLDFSPAGSVFESEDCDGSMFENDESGVESVDGDWLQLCNTPPSEYDLDLTEEQALETLKYFSKFEYIHIRHIYLTRISPLHIFPVHFEDYIMF